MLSLNCTFSVLINVLLQIYVSVIFIIDVKNVVAIDSIICVLISCYDYRDGSRLVGGGGGSQSVVVICHSTYEPVVGDTCVVLLT